MSLRDDIRKANQRKVQAILVPEWGLTVYVRQLSAGESLELADRGRAFLNGAKDEAEISTENKKQLMALQLAAFVCDEAGVPQFDAAQARAELVDEGIRGPAQRIITEALKINGQESLEIVKGNS